jgi:protein-tyrosine phosphatase
MTEGAPFRIAIVCLGNICRSPMAQVVLEDRLERAGLADQVEVVSAGTGDWHVGESMDRRAAATLTDAGYDATRHVAQTFTTDWYAEHDLLLAMDASNRADITDLAPTVEAQGQVRMFREFDPEASDGDDEVPDPWYGGSEGFAEVLAMVERTADEIISRLPEIGRAFRSRAGSERGIRARSGKAEEEGAPGSATTDENAAGRDAGPRSRREGPEGTS